MLSDIGPAQVAAEFREAMACLGLPVPLSQRDVKLPVVVTVDRLIGLAYEQEQPAPRLWANRIDLPDPAGALRFTQHFKLESMVDVVVYRGYADPFVPLATAESEAYCQHPIDESSCSENSDYLWDLFKLLQVPSPLRLFVARVSGLDRCRVLERRIGHIVSCYAECYRSGDRIFSIVLPTSARHFEPIRCFGWVKGGTLEPLAG
jgi:hypothetical protein